MLSPGKKRILRSLIAKHGLQEAEAAIVAQSSECVTLIRGGRESYVAVGNSRFGGVPDLPASLPWPRSTSGYLNFLMQINLRELPPVFGNPLPKSGMLYYFIEDDDCATRVVSQVLFYGGRLTLLRKATAPPVEELANENYCDLTPHKVTTAAAIDVPGYGSPLFAHIQASIPANENGDGGDRMFNLIYDARRLKKRQERVGQLLGHSPELAGEVRENAYLTSVGKQDRIYDYTYRSRNKRKLETEAKKWGFLWQIGSDLRVGVCIHDAGDLGVFIRPPDLAKRDFSRIYAEIDST